MFMNLIKFLLLLINLDFLPEGTYSDSETQFSNLCLYQMPQHVGNVKIVLCT